MAAVLSPTTAPWHHPAPRETPPTLRVIEGGRATRTGAGVLRHAGLLVAAGLLAAVLLAMALSLGVRALGAGAAAPQPAPTAASSAANDPVVPGDGIVVVRAGDTLWGIAQALRPQGDVRALVDRLAERAGGPELSPGQRIDVRGLG
jgi:Tfp pilus assembly protein FimV